MTKKKRVIRGIVNSVLLAAIVTLGVCVYQSKNEENLQKQLAQKEQVEEYTAPNDTTKETEEPLLDAGTSKVQADLENQEEPTDSGETQDSQEAETSEEDTTEDENTPEEESTITAPSDSTSVQMLPQPDFTESSLMVWPLSGDVLMDYSMDNTIYDPTLNVYRYNPGIVVAASPEAPVLSAAAGTIASITENEETGTTVSVDLGNGYQAIYGQLHNLEIAEGQAVEQSTILGYVADPTKYYSVEGHNLYFAMTKDGQAVDPVSYLP